MSRSRGFLATFKFNSRMHAEQSHLNDTVMFHLFPFLPLWSSHHPSHILVKECFTFLDSNKTFLTVVEYCSHDRWDDCIPCWFWWNYIYIFFNHIPLLACMMFVYRLMKYSSYKIRLFNLKICILLSHLAALTYKAYVFSKNKAYKRLEFLVFYAGIPERNPVRKYFQMMSPTNVAYHSLKNFAVIYSFQDFCQFFYFSLRKCVLLLAQKLRCLCARRSHCTKKSQRA